MKSTKKKIITTTIIIMILIAVCLALTNQNQSVDFGCIDCQQTHYPTLEPEIWEGMKK